MKLTKSIQLELIPQLGRKKKKKTNNKSPKLILIVKTLDKIQILIPKPHNAISAESHFTVKPHFQPCRKIIHLIAFCNNTRDILSVMELEVTNNKEDANAVQNTVKQLTLTRN